MTKASQNECNAITFSPAVLRLYKNCPITDKMKYKWTTQCEPHFNCEARDHYKANTSLFSFAEFYMHSNRNI